MAENKITLLDLFSKKKYPGFVSKKHIIASIVSTIISLIAIALLSIITIVSRSVNKKNIEDQCINDLNNTMEQLSDQLDSMLISDKLYLDSIANILSVIEYDADVYLEIVDNFNSGQLIHRINIMLPDGTIFMTNHRKIVNQQIAERFDIIVERGYYISDKGPYFIDETECVFHSYPVLKNGEAIAVIYGFMDLEQLSETFTSFSWYDNTDQMFIIEAGTKKLILDTQNKKHGDIDSFFSVYDFGDDNQRLVEKITNETKAIDIYNDTDTDEDLFVCLMGVDASDWVLLLVIPKDKVLENLNIYNKIMSITFGGSILLVAVLILILIIYSRHQMVIVGKAYDEEHKEKALLDNVYSSIPTGIIRVMYSEETREIVFANVAAANIFGYEDVPNLMNNFKDGIAQVIHPDDLKKIHEGSQKLIDVWDKVQTDLRIIHKNNEIRIVRAHTTLISNDAGVKIVQHILQDITDEIRIHQVENDLKREQYFAQIFDILSANTPNAYILFSLPDFSVEYVSDNIERLLGFDIDLIYQDGLDVVRPVGMDPTESRNSVLVIPVNKSMKYERIRKLKNTGEERIFEDTFHITEIDGKRKGLAIFSDVTEDKRARQTLAAAVDNANNASKAKTDFLYNMSHDIRTPMNAIYGLVQLLSKDISKDSNAGKNLEKINIASESMLEIINNILDMSRIEAGKVVLNEAAFDVEDIINEIVVVYTEQAKNKNLALSKEIRLTNKKYIGDYIRLKQIITNLLSNAIKYTNDGGWVNLSIETIVDNNADYDVVCFIVSDNGIGMSEEFQKIIYTPFAREKSSTQSGVNGTGLGMAIVKNLTELMGGHITIQSEIGIGTTITAEIPFKRVDTDIIVDKEVFGSDVTTDIRGINILVAEDNDLNSDIIIELLEDEGAKCIRAKNGKEAFDIFMKSANGEIDAILMDVQMPVMNGYEATQAIRSSDHPQAMSIKIIAMTANAFIEDVRHAFDAGMDCHISKPIYIDELCKTLNLLLKKQE